MNNTYHNKVTGEVVVGFVPTTAADELDWEIIEDMPIEDGEWLYGNGAWVDKTPQPTDIPMDEWVALENQFPNVARVIAEVLDG